MTKSKKKFRAEFTASEKILMEFGLSERAARILNFVVYHSFSVAFVIMAITGLFYTWNFYNEGCAQVCKTEEWVRSNGTSYKIECKPVKAVYETWDESDVRIYYKSINSFEEGRWNGSEGWSVVSHINTEES